MYQRPFLVTLTEETDDLAPGCFYGNTPAETLRHSIATLRRIDENVETIASELLDCDRMAPADRLKIHRAVSALARESESLRDHLLTMLGASHHYQ
jgi:hypothetical protein